MHPPVSSARDSQPAASLWVWQQSLHWHVTHLTRTNSICWPNFGETWSMVNVLLLPFRSLPFYRHRHVILSRPTEFYPTRTTPSGVKTSYQFSRWQPWHRRLTSRWGFSHFTHLSRSKFDPDQMLVRCGRDITTSGFWKQTADIFEFYFRFAIWLYMSFWDDSLYNLTSFVDIHLAKY